MLHVENHEDFLEKLYRRKANKQPEKKSHKVVDSPLHAVEFII